MQQKGEETEAGSPIRSIGSAKQRPRRSAWTGKPAGAPRPQERWPRKVIATTRRLEHYLRSAPAAADRLTAASRALPASAGMTTTSGTRESIASGWSTSGTETGLALTEIGQGGQIRLRHLRPHRQDSKGIGCETIIRLGIADSQLAIHWA